MEEKTIKREETSSATSRKLSYEELENVAHQLSKQANQFYTKLQEVEMSNIFKRLDFLFKVVENRSAFSTEFTRKSINEIEELMTIPEESEKDTTSEANNDK